MTICDLCFEKGVISEAPETCVECSADMCPEHGEGEFAGWNAGQKTEFLQKLLDAIKESGAHPFALLGFDPIELWSRLKHYYRP